MKKVVLVSVLMLTCLTAGTAALAAISGIGSVASNMTSNFANVAKLLTAASYVVGMAFAVGGIVKFKAHKDNPTQIPIGTPIALLFIGAALMFLPSVIKVTEATMFAQSGVTGGVSGITDIQTGK